MAWLKWNSELISTTNCQIMASNCSTNPSPKGRVRFDVPKVIRNSILIYIYISIWTHLFQSNYFQFIFSHFILRLWMKRSRIRNLPQQPNSNNLTEIKTGDRKIDDSEDLLILINRIEIALIFRPCHSRVRCRPGVSLKLEFTFLWPLKRPQSVTRDI